MSPSSAASLVLPLDPRDPDRAPGRALVAHVRCSTVADGDFHLDGDRAALGHRRRTFMPGTWTQLDEVHGTVVRRVTRPGEHDGAVGDALVTDRPGATLGIWVGDCAPLVLLDHDGAVGAAHVGWKGALDGVVGALVASMRPGRHTALLGPCIHPCCYEFGPVDLAAFVDRFGPSVVGRTTWGTPSLDMPAVVRAALAEHGIALDEPYGHALGGCTGCTPGRWYSHRRRGERGRQMMAVRLMAGD